ncbi:MAG: hypothetical protein DRH57_08550 [Candidatus Cloacimonadota bacterium]|nr:MAG: hypothetical protein DRH57_08550 [Candidatus Cloacimonadota bacterium]
MKGKIGFGYVTVPDDLNEINYVWKTHVPSLSFKKYEVESIYKHSNSENISIILKPYDGKKVQRIICERHKDCYTVKNNIQFSEREAAKRLSNHIGQIVAGHPQNADIDIDIVNENMEFLKENYPELVL